MQIKTLNNNITNFTSLYRRTSYIDCNGVFRESQNTTNKRNDLDYKECANLIKKRFSEFDRINVMPMNGSDGTESYILAHYLLEEFGEKKAKEKIFPITVTDVDSFIINKFGKKGIVALTPNDIEAFGNKFDTYFEEISMSELPNIPFAYSLNSKAFKLTPFFKSLFEFKQQDFQNRVSELKDEANSVVIIRNCFAQSFGYVQTMLFVAELAKKLQKTSMFVIGQYDRDCMKYFVPEMKSIFGFKEIGKNIFSRQANSPLESMTMFVKKFL